MERNSRKVRKERLRTTTVSFGLPDFSDFQTKTAKGILYDFARICTYLQKFLIAMVYELMSIVKNVMPLKQYSTTVVIPDNSNIEAQYYCSDNKLNHTEKETLTQLIIQLHDCICILKIEKTISNKQAVLENLVHKKVINTKDHLC